jgi:hypothetical protein
LPSAAAPSISLSLPPSAASGSPLPSGGGRRERSESREGAGWWRQSHQKIWRESGEEVFTRCHTRPASLSVGDAICHKGRPSASEASHVNQSGSLAPGGGHDKIEPLNSCQDSSQLVSVSAASQSQYGVRTHTTLLWRLPRPGPLGRRRDTALVVWFGYCAEERGRRRGGHE